MKLGMKCLKKSEFSWCNSKLRIVNWEAFYHTFGASGKNYKVAQSSARWKNKKQFKFDEIQNAVIIISCCLILCFFLIGRELFLNTWYLP